MNNHADIAKYEVGNHLIPGEYLSYKSPGRFYSLMEKRSKPVSVGHIRSHYKKTISLDSFMRFILPFISCFECETIETSISADDLSIADKMAEAIIDDLTFISDKVGVQVTLTMQDQYLVISQEAIDKMTRLYFMGSEKQIVFTYDDKCYLYHSGMLKEAAEKAKAEKDQQAIKNETEQRKSNRGSVFDSVIKIIKFNKSEEIDDGD